MPDTAPRAPDNDRVRRADDGADLVVEPQERHELGPGVLPKPDDRRVDVAPLAGELVESDGAKVTKSVKGLRHINPTGKLVWERDLASGKTLTITFTSRVYVHSGR